MATRTLAPYGSSAPPLGEWAGSAPACFEIPLFVHAAHEETHAHTADVNGDRGV